MAVRDSTVDLSTTWLGLELEHPILPGSSPLAANLDAVRRLEDAGAPAIVLPSLFEEQIEREQREPVPVLDDVSRELAEAIDLVPGPPEFELGPHEYLEHLARVKAAVGVPVVASLNGATHGGWLAYARLMEEAGADALELNLYELEVEPGETAAAVERAKLAVVGAVADALDIPVAVKLLPFYTSLAHFVVELERAGAAGVVLFNAFYQPDVDIEVPEVVPRVFYSDRSALLLRLRWLALLAGRTRLSLVCSGGVHQVEDVVKAVMCGADAVQSVSELLKRGPGRLTELRDELAQWLAVREYDTLAEMKGATSLAQCPDPRQFERIQYMRVLRSWRPPAAPRRGS